MVIAQIQKSICRLTRIERKFGAFQWKFGAETGNSKGWRRFREQSLAKKVIKIETAHLKIRNMYKEYQR